jgi:hypothetical protein
MLRCLSTNVRRISVSVTVERVIVSVRRLSTTVKYISIFPPEFERLKVYNERRKRRNYLTQTGKIFIIIT